MRPDPEAHRPPAAALRLRNLSMALRLIDTREKLLEQLEALGSFLEMRIKAAPIRDEAIEAMVRPVIESKLRGDIAVIESELAMLGVVVD